MIEHLTNSPDLATFGYFLIEKKKKIHRYCFYSKDDINEVTKEHFRSIPRNGWLEAFNL